MPLLCKFDVIIDERRDGELDPSGDKKWREKPQEEVEKKNKRKKNSVPLFLCDPGWLRGTKKYAGKGSPRTTLQSEAHVSPWIGGTVTKIV